MGSSQLVVRDPYGNLIKATRNFAVQSRTWVTNEAGAATITVPVSDPDVGRVCAWGNILRVNEYGIRPWVGQALSREVNAGVVTLACKSAEQMLAGKVTGPGRVYGGQSGVSAGQVALDLYNNAAVANNDLRVFSAGAFTARAMTFRIYNYADLFDSLKKLATDTGAEFWVDQDLKVNFTDVRGSDLRQSVVLREGLHLANVRVIEDVTDLATAVVVLGDEIAGAVRPSIRLKRVGQPFFRVKVSTISGAKDATALEAPAKTALQTGSQPSIKIDATVAKINGSFGAFWVGDIIQLVIKHPFLRRLDVKVNSIELGTDESMRAVFEVLNIVEVSDFVPWSLT